MLILRKAATAAAILFTGISFAQNHPVAWTNSFDVNFFKVQQVGFSTDSKHLAVGYDDGNVNIFTTDSGNVVRNYRVHSSHIFCTKFRPGTTAVASGDKMGDVVFYDYAAGKELHRLHAHEKPVTAMYFSSDGKLLVTGSKDKTIKVWDAATGNLLHTITYRKGNKVQSLYLREEDRTVIAGITGVTRGLRFFDIQSGMETENYDVANLEHFDVSPDGVMIAIGSLHRQIYMFNMKRRAFVAKYKGHKRYVTDVSFNNTGKVLFTASNDNNVFAWLADGSKHMPLYHTRRDIDAVKCSPDGKYLAIMAENESMVVIEVAQIEAEIKAYKPPVKL